MHIREEKNSDAFIQGTARLSGLISISVVA